MGSGGLPKKVTLGNFRVLKDSVRDVLLTHRIVAGKVSAEIFRNSEHGCFFKP